MKTENEPSATDFAPLPFGNRLYDLLDANGQLVAVFETLHDAAKARIACNSHDALVAALKRIAEISENGLNPGGNVYLSLNIAKSAAKAALETLAQS